jgi:hypothetical protein
MAGPGRPGPAPGNRGGGRQKGTPNKDTRDVLAHLAALGCDPIAGMAQIAMCNVPCLNCKGSGEASYRDGKTVPDGSEGAVKSFCLRCLGDGLEPVPVDLRAKMFAELAQYVAPKRKAVEHSGPDGDAIPHEHLHVIDISKLTPDELEAAEKLGASVARAKAGAGNQS